MFDFTLTLPTTLKVRQFISEIPLQTYSFIFITVDKLNDIRYQKAGWFGK